MIMDINRFFEVTDPLGLQLIEIPNCSNIVAYNSYYTGPNANWWHTAVILMKTLWKADASIVVQLVKTVPFWVKEP